MALDCEGAQVEEDRCRGARRSHAEQLVKRLRGEQRSGDARSRRQCRIRGAAAGAVRGELVVERVLAPGRRLQALQAGRLSGQDKRADSDLRRKLARGEVGTPAARQAVLTQRGSCVAVRELLRMRYDLDLTQVEIAARLGLPEGTVKVRLHRARAKLRRALTV